MGKSPVGRERVMFEWGLSGAVCCDRGMWAGA